MAVYVGLAGLGEIPTVIVRGQPAEQSYIDAVVENLLRENLNALDRAFALLRIKDSLGGGFKEVARRVGLTERRVFHLLGLIGLPEAGQDEIRLGKLNEKHGPRGPHYMLLHMLLAWLCFGQAARSSAVLVCLEVWCGWLETGEDQAIRLPGPLSSRDIVGFPLQQRRSSKTTFASNDLVFTG